MHEIDIIFPAKIREMPMPGWVRFLADSVPAGLFMPCGYSGGWDETTLSAMSVTNGVFTSVDQSIRLSQLRQRVGLDSRRHTATFRFVGFCLQAVRKRVNFSVNNFSCFLRRNYRLLTAFGRDCSLMSMVTREYPNNPAFPRVQPCLHGLSLAGGFVFLPNRGALTH
jgi:hypothetical protein